MKTYTQEELDKQFDQAPAIVREALFSKETSDRIKLIGDRHKLHIDQIGSLSDEIGLVMLGLEPSNIFVSNIETRLGIERSLAEQIATNVNKEIFLKIRESLKQMEENKNTPKQDELLREIENQTALPKISEEKRTIFERKLTENFLTGSPDTPTTANNPTPIKKIDPYLERPE
ncbi:hypothetical protein IT398_01215 [Candidatus Nomurabacteria bacterium]|nr:hypothetical protein [Candidatus Nomurabacteria bacterium]